jgi:tRNA threonylcarbamoyladenosine biosynthesis protein TsaB
VSLVLAVDTTTANGSVAVGEPGRVRGELRLASEDAHSARLLPGVEFLLASLALTPADLGGYAVVAGPGSFTGLRVGLSTVQGLALASGRPCLGVSALDLLAERMRGAAPHLAAMMEAGRGEVYAGLYDGAARPLGEALRVEPAAFLARVPAGAAFLGDWVLEHESHVRAAQPAAVLPRRSLFLAGTLARVAAARLAAGEGAGPEALRPLYLREADIRPGPR